MSHPRWLSHIVKQQLIQPFILFLLPCDILPDHPFVTAHRRHVVSPCPKVFPNKVPRLSAIIAGYVYRALPFDIPYLLLATLVP